MPHKEDIDALGKILGELTTAENAETIAKGKDLLSSLGKDYDEAVSEGQKAKDSLVRLVQNMPVKQEQPGPQDPAHENQVTIDDALTAAISKLEAERLQKK